MKSGLVLVDKPADWTSHDVVAKLRRLLDEKKIGHAGTLDPMATGLLLLGVGSGTKLLSFLVGLDKSYQAIIRLGQSTVTDDATGEVTETADKNVLDALTEQQITIAIESFNGQTLQLPSKVSALKVAGQRAYDMVRSGAEFELKPRLVTMAIKLLSIQLSSGFIDVAIEVDCSSGTYIRALARDLGSKLKVFGHLRELRRTRIGNYLIADARAIEQIKPEHIQPVALAAAQLFPTVTLKPKQCLDVYHGKRLGGIAIEGERVAAVSEAGELVAILERHQKDLKSVVVFQGAIND